MTRQQSQLHLAPRGSPSQRIWRIGYAASLSDYCRSGDLELDVRRDDHESFATFKAVLRQIMPYAREEHASRLETLIAYLRDACPDSDSASDSTTHGGFLSNSVALSIMRRISRESVYTARVIELGAQLLNDILSESQCCDRAHIFGIDRLDRPSVKVFARAILLLQPSHGFSWVLHSQMDPRRPIASENDIYLRSRHSLLAVLVAILNPRFELVSKQRPHVKHENHAKNLSTYAISCALVVQNYDACFLWCDELLLSGDNTKVVEALRLKGLAAINCGFIDDGLRSFTMAESISDSRTGRAHLCYLQGLVEAKRNYDLRISEEHYNRGLTSLKDASLRTTDDVDLERAWLLNGLALNEAIIWRRHSGNHSRFSTAFSLEQDAFKLVREGDDPARTYLRFNLLANTAFLLEMTGAYDRAIELFRTVFDSEVAESSLEYMRLKSTIGYRIGMLQYRAGHLTEASRLLRQAASRNLDHSWSLRERILRALGTTLLRSRAYDEAVLIFKEGLSLCRAARAADGTREHSKGLVWALRMAGQASEAETIIECLRTEEGLDISAILQTLSSESALLQLSPKLPAYIPEIDLEGIPLIDLNRFLGNVGLPQHHTPVWR